MSRITNWVILILCLLVVLTGYNYFVRPFASLSQWTNSLSLASPSPSPTPSTALAMWQGLTTDQKIWQLLAAPVVINQRSIATPLIASASADFSPPTKAQQWLSGQHPGWVTIFGEQISSHSARLVIDQLTDLSLVPTDQPLTWWPVVMVDHEGGEVQRLSGLGFTRLPSWQSTCQLSQERKIAIWQQSARELKSVGIDVVLAPVVDMASRHPILKTRICAADYQTVTTNSQLWITIFKEAGLTSVIKHFPSIGQTTKDLHREFDRITVTADDAQLYRSLLDQFPDLGVMVSHVGVINQYQHLPCSLSSSCIGQLSQLYPQALVISDALEMKSAAYVNPQVWGLPDSNGSSSARSAPAQKTLADIAYQAILAGNDVLVFGQSVDQTQLETIVQRLSQAYGSDKLFTQAADRQGERVISWKLKRGKIKPIAK